MNGQAATMNVRELGDVTAAYARDMGLVGEISRVTNIIPGWVGRRLASAHGRSLVRSVFEKEWPSKLAEIGLTYARDAASRSFVSGVAEITSLPAATVRERVQQAAPDATVRSVFEKEWFDPRAARLPDLGAMPVSAARDLGLADRLAEVLGLDPRATLRRLTAAHGAALVRNVFANEWPETPPPAPQKPHLIAARYELLDLLGEGGFGMTRRLDVARAVSLADRVLKFATGTSSSTT